MSGEVTPQKCSGHPRRVTFLRGSSEFDRVVNFTDAVIAIAMTLLILGVELPRPDPADADVVSVLDLIDDLWPQIFAFLLGFAIIGFYWLDHHSFVARLRGVDHALMVWNLVYLLAIVLLPFMSELIGYYPGNEQAVAIYAAWFVVLGLLGLGGYVLAWRRHLLDTEPSPAMIRFQFIAQLNAPVVFLVSIGIAIWVSPTLAMWSWLLIWPIAAFSTRHPPDH